MRWAGITGGAVAGVVLLFMVALAAGTIAWRRGTAAAVEALPRPTGSGRPAGRESVRASVAPGALPPPVARYLELALPTSLTASTALIDWTGEFRMRPDAAWVPFRASQHFTLDRPGFVWDASIRMMPVVPMRVRDSYGAGRGAMTGRIGGLLTVVDAPPTPELAQSALARWIGEAVWLPMALAPGGPVRWEAIDDSTARAVVDDERIAASAVFHFGAGGEIRRMEAMRYRDVDGTPVLTAFEGVYRDYVRMGDVVVPRFAEVAWLLPEGRFAYWRARPVRLHFD